MHPCRSALVGVALLEMSVLLVGCEGVLSVAEPRRRPSPMDDSGTPGFDAGTTVPMGEDAGGTVLPEVDSGPPIPGVDSGPPIMGNDAGPPARPDSGPPGMDAGPPMLPNPYPNATVGSACVGGARQEVLILSTGPADCSAHAGALASADPARFVVLRLPGSSPFNAGATMCADGACEMTTVRVSVTSDASGARGEWTAPIRGAMRGGAFSATRCDYDAFLPSAGDATISGLTLSEVALYQGVKVSIARGGSAVELNAPIVAGRDGMLRLFVTPGSGFTARSVLARVTLGSGAPLEARATISRASTDADLASTINVEIPGERLTPGVSFSVGLYDPAASCGGGAGSTASRFPASGTTTLAAQSMGGTFRVVLVPVRYGADGSGRMPDTSAANVAAFRDLMMSMYPVEDLQVTVRSTPLEWDSTVSANGNGWSALLEECMNVRSADRPPADTYYYCLFNPASSFRTFCSGGCVSGLGPVPSARDTFSRASIGLGFAGSEGTFVHEVGHSLGRPHAPCGGASGAEASFPYSGGRIGSWGYDILTGELFNPSSHTDMMGYCDPVWISDYNYENLFTRIRAVRGVASVRDAMPVRYVSAIIDADGALDWGHEVELDFPPDGQALSATWSGASGATQVDAVLLPVSHVSGGIVYVPLPDDGAPTGTVLSIDGMGTLTR